MNWNILWQNIVGKNRIWVIVIVVIFFTFTYTADSFVLVPSCVSMKSDQSMDLPHRLAEGSVPAGQRWVVLRTFHRKYNHQYSHLKYTWSIKVYQRYFKLDIYLRWAGLDAKGNWNVSNEGKHQARRFIHASPSWDIRKPESGKHYRRYNESDSITLADDLQYYQAVSEPIVWCHGTTHTELYEWLLIISYYWSVYWYNQQ